VLVLIPYQSGCPHREAALGWVLWAYHSEFPEWEVVVSRLEDGVPWNKAKALMAAEDALDRHQKVLVADADVWCHNLKPAKAALADHEWAVPHKGVFRLSPEATDQVLGGAEPDEDMTLDQRAYPGTVGGGMVLTYTETFRRVPLDPRFDGWGQEDESWGLALYMLAGHPWRGKAPLYHLWHPPQERMTRRVGSVASRQLQRRYNRATTPEDIQALLDEVTT
jgi:hypothetical protein